MSLIDEALKRARLDAARQDEAQRRAGVPWVPTMAPTRRRRAWMPAVLAGAIVAIVGIGLGLVLFRGGAPEPVPATAEPVAVEAPPAAAPPTASQPVLVEEGLPAPAQQAPPVGPEPAPVPQAAAPSPPPPTAERRPAAPSQPPPRRIEPAPPAAVPSTPSAVSTATDPGAPTYLRDADLPSGKRLSLTGIAYSAQPIAVINGTVVGPGEFVEGYAVAKIEPDRVELRSDEGTVVLLLRQRQ